MGHPRSKCDDQDGILTGERDQHDNTNLRIKVRLSAPGGGASQWAAAKRTRTYGLDRALVARPDERSFAARDRATSGLRTLPDDTGRRAAVGCCRPVRGNGTKDRWFV